MNFVIFTEKGKRFNRKPCNRTKLFIWLRKKGMTYQAIADLFGIKHRQQVQEAITDCQQAIDKSREG